MAKITFITPEENTIIAVGESGSIMELAVSHDVPGIEGDCGGVCSCGTCHVHVLPEFIHLTGTAQEIESDMLEFQDNASEYSRLACQIQISDALDGLILKVTH